MEKTRFLLQRIPVAQPFRLSEQIEGHGKENFTRFHAARQLGSVQRSRRRVGISPHKSARAKLYAAEVTGHNHRGVDKLLLLDYVQYGLPAVPDGSPSSEKRFVPPAENA